MECFVGSATNAVAPISSGGQGGAVARTAMDGSADEETGEMGQERWLKKTGSSLLRNSVHKLATPDTNNKARLLKPGALVRKLSAFQSSTKAACPSLAMRHGSLCSYLYAPHPSPGKGLCFSPNGDLFIRFGFSSDVKLMRTHDCSVVTTLKGSPGHVRYANFSTDGKFLMAASDGERKSPAGWSEFSALGMRSRCLSH
jgi:WD40 repeat protein